MRNLIFLILLLFPVVCDAGMPPNVIWIMADDLGYGDIGPYGQEKIQTPRLDEMAAEGLKFTQFYAGSTVCAASRCVLMTGLHNGHGRVRDNVPVPIHLQPDDKTVAEYLKQAGYHTAIVGKWGLGDTGTWGIPNAQGFDFFYGHLAQTHAHFYYPHELWRNQSIEPLPGNRGGARKQYTTDLFNKESMQFIRDNKSRPFFLYLSYTTPHFSDYPGKSVLSQDIPSDEPYTNKDWPQVEKNYAAMVTKIDTDVGRILDLVKELGLDENTLVCFTSDNGPCSGRAHDVDYFQSGGPFRGVKRELNEGGIRVPLIARWPGKIKPGTTTDLISGFQDLLPTLVELAGLPEPKKTDGVSLVPTLLSQGDQKEHEYLYWDYAHVRGNFMQAIRLNDWKGIRLGLNAPMELYDLKSDPGEKKNLSNENQDVVNKLVQLMDEAYVESPDYPVK